MVYAWIVSPVCWRCAREYESHRPGIGAGDALLCDDSNLGHPVVACASSLSGRQRHSGGGAGSTAGEDGHTHDGWSVVHPPGTLTDRSVDCSSTNRFGCNRAFSSCATDCFG